MGLLPAATHTLMCTDRDPAEHMQHRHTLHLFVVRAAPGVSGCQCRHLMSTSSHLPPAAHNIQHTHQATQRQAGTLQGLRAQQSVFHAARPQAACSSTKHTSPVTDNVTPASTTLHMPSRDPRPCL